MNEMGESGAVVFAAEPGIQHEELSIGWMGWAVIALVALLLVKGLCGRSRSAGRLVFSLGALLGILALGSVTIFETRHESRITEVSVPRFAPRHRTQSTIVVADSRTGQTRQVVVSHPSPEPLAQAAPMAPLPPKQPSGQTAKGASQSAKAAAPDAEVSGSIPVEIADAADGPSSRPRPTWADEKGLVKSGSDYYATIKVGPFHEDVLDREVAFALPAATYELVDTIVGQQGAGVRVDLPLHFIRDELIDDQWVGEYESKRFDLLGMKEYYARLKFSEPARQEIRRRYNEAVVQQRLGYAGSMAGFLLLVLATLFGYLRLDTATRGYYSGRLKLAAAATILAGSAATVAFLHSFAGV